MEIYPYQQECLGAIESARQTGSNKALVVMATGLGKTVISALELKQLLKEAPGRILYVTHQNEILRQARRTYEEILSRETTYGYFHGQEKHLHAVDVLFASFQTMATSREQFARKEFKYIVIDEAHHVQADTYRPTVEYFQPDFMIGLTATPDRADQKDIRELMGEPVFDLGLFDALANRHLTPIDYRLMTDELQNLEVLETPVGKLSIAELNRTIFIPKRDEEIVRIIEEKLEGVTNPRTIIFCSSVWHAEQLGELMPYAQIIHSKVNKDQRVRRISAFRKGYSRVVITVDMFNEGIDIPEANVIVFLRSTASRTIYLQQLGRGLRRTQDKEEVLVLDFVANCERIEMIDYVKQGVEKAIQGTIENDFDTQLVESSASRNVLTLTIASGSFDERLVNLIDIVNRVREGYTKEALIEQIRKLAKELRRTPFLSDLNKREGYASTKTFIEHFGSWNKALRAAGFDPTKEIKFYSDEELIQQLSDLGKQLERIPRVDDVDAAKNIASSATFTMRFKTWRGALRSAGYSPTHGVMVEREALIQLLLSIAKKLDRVPIVKDLENYDRVNPKMYTREFGSWNNALEAAGISPTRKRYNRQELIDQLLKKYKEVGHSSFTKQLGRKNGMASQAAFLDEFGSWEKALEAAGIDREDITQEKLIEGLRRLESKLGRVPSIADLKKEPSLPGYRIFVKLFGSWGNALVAAGYDSSKIVYTKEDLIKQIQSVSIELGRKPTSRDVVDRKGSMANITTFYEHFGSWSNALKEAGF